jgi:hypothetical protein
MFRWIGVAAGIIGLGWMVRELAQLGPRDVGVPVAAPVRVRLTEEQWRLAEEAAAIERRHAGQEAGGGVDPDMEAELTRAIGLLDTLLQANRHAGAEHSERRERLVQAQDTLRARPLVARIAALSTPESGGEPTAEALREALHLQQTVNRSQAAPRSKDYVRETQLALALVAAEAGPLRREVDEAVARATQAAAAGDWPAALAAYERAHATLIEVNRRFPGTRFADLALQERLAGELTAIGAATAAAEVDGREQGGDAAAAAGRTAAAIELYGLALAAQRALDARFPRSRFASTQRVDELEVKLQTLQAGELVERALATEGAAAALIFQRRLLGAAEKLAESAALVAQAERKFPRSRRELGALKLKLAYLELRRPDHAALQDELYAQLLPVPGAPDRLMLRTEVAQALYGQVMNTNPSRHPGPARPVDSVAGSEAQEFCRRLGWLLGTAVRLPTEAEFRQALGRDRVPGWSEENSAGQTQPTGEVAANANGFCDLLGNVAEWLHADDGPARVAGGSYLDSAEALAAVPVGPVDRATRARHLGFRVVVEFPIE